MTMSDEPAAAVVIGLGNVYRSDDAAGLLVARRVRKSVASGVRVIEREGEPVGLLDDWDGLPLAVVVDALRNVEAPSPGRIHRFQPLLEPVPASFRHRGSHTIGLADAIELGRAMGRLPRRLVVYAIEGSDFASGDRCSPEVLAAVDGTAERVLQELADVPR
jgi:hydrogenase maturation protease